MAIRSKWVSGNLVFYNSSATGCLQIGLFASAAQGSGLKLSSTRSANFRVYGDDGGAAMWAAGSVPDLRNSLSRLLVTADQTGGHVRLAAELGQLKAYNAAWNTEQAAGVYGYLELVRASGTVTFGGYGKTAAVLGCVETSGTMTVDTNHILAGVAAISKLAGTGLTQTGKVAAFLADIYDTSNWSDGTARTAWGYGLLLQPTAVKVGVCIPGGTSPDTGTAGTAIQVGTLSAPLALNTAGQFGIKAFFSSTATTGTLTGARLRAIANAASGTPGVYGVLAQASTAASKYAGEMAGIRAEAILKASSVIGATSYGVSAAYLKVEDEPATAGSGTSPTNGAECNVLTVAAQLSSDPTGGLNMILVDCQSATGGTGVQAADAFVKFRAGGQNAAIVSLFEFETGGGWATAGKLIVHGGAAAAAVAGYLHIKVNGTAYRIPYLADTDS